MQQSNNNVIPRMTGVLIIEVKESNPNGDPDRESDPRTLPDRRGVISAVSFKRKVRDLVLEKEGAIWQAISDEMRLEPKRFDILENRDLIRGDVTNLLKGGKGEDRKKSNYKEFHDRFWDARLFGNTFLESSEGEEKQADDVQKANLRSSVRNGVVQIVNAHSVCPVEVVRSTNTKRAGAQEGKDRGMAPLGDRRVLHGVYVMPFFVNPALAHRTYCSLQDVEVLLRLIPVAYPATASRARPFVEVRHAFIAEHKTPLGSFSDLDFVSRFTPRRMEGANEMPSSDWSQYEVNKTLEGFQGVAVNFRDLCVRNGTVRP